MNKETFENVMKLSLSLTSNQIFLIFTDNTAKIEEKIGKREVVIEEITEKLMTLKHRTRGTTKADYFM